MFIRSSRFLSLIFPPTVYHVHVLLPLLRGNERFIWSVAHVNASWSMSKYVSGTWACLTQHPSDTLRPYLELNCRTSYDTDLVYRFATCLLFLRSSPPRPFNSLYLFLGGRSDSPEVIIWSCIRKAYGSSLGQNTGYPDFGILCFSSRPMSL
jgi:hypothetical protein